MSPAAFSLVQTLNVPTRVHLGPSLAAVSLDSLFDHPVGIPAAC
jgi:hypothetical protein